MERRPARGPGSVEPLDQGRSRSHDRSTGRGWCFQAVVVRPALAQPAVWDEEFSSGDFDADEDGLSPDRFRQLYMDRLDLAPDDEAILDTIIQAHQKDAAATELPAHASRAYVQLADKIGYSSQGPSGPPDAEGAPFDPEGAFQKGIEADAGASFGGGGSIGGILGPLRQLSYWSMKKRARRIGETGMHLFTTELMNAAPQARLHLMGHSFGTIVVSGILGGPDASHALPRQADSVALVQGAVSLWAFGESVHGKALKGYFNPWLRRQACTRAGHRLSIDSRSCGWPAISLGIGHFVF